MNNSGMRDKIRPGLAAFAVLIFSIAFLVTIVGFLPANSSAAGVSASCTGYCDNKSPSGCWCDSLCKGYGDCCPGFDYASMCGQGQTNATNTTKTIVKCDGSTNPGAHNGGSINITYSDGGKGVSQDYCFPIDAPNYSAHYYCTGTNSYALNAIQCPNGCKDGACLSQNQTKLPTSTCTLSISPAKASFAAGESWTFSLNYCPASTQVQICTKTPSPSGNSCTPMGSTDVSGKWTKSGTFSAADAGTWTEYAKVGSSTSNEIAFTVQSILSIAGLQGYDQDTGQYSSQAQAGKYIILYGAFPASGNVVYVKDVPHTPTYQSSTQINVKLDPQITGGYSASVYVSNAGVKSNVQSIYVNPPVQPPNCILSISPSKTSFTAGESWTINLVSCPVNTQVQFCTKLPSASCTPMGSTDGAGKWSKSGTFSAADAGTWTEYAKVGSTTSNDISFTITASASPQTPASPCTGYCNTYSTSSGCWCDSLCKGYGDCCAGFDYSTMC